jgi:DNA gyrase subunit A
MKKELRALKKKFSDDRRTRIQPKPSGPKKASSWRKFIAEEVEEETVLEFTQKGYVRRSSLRSYQRRQAPGGPQRNQFEEAEDPMWCCKRKRPSPPRNC